MTIAGVSAAIIRWALWPIFYLLVNGSVRSRVLLVHKSSVLVIKHRLGDGKWALPGGGVHKNESLKHAAAREIYEELGITLLPKNLISLGRTQHKRRGIQCELALFYMEVPARLAISAERLEIADAKWLGVNKLNKNNTDTDVLAHLAAWRRKK